MKIFKSIKKVFDTEYCFNLSQEIWKERMQWVRDEAKKIPEGSVVLDIGAGTCEYLDDFKHCKYITQDFSQNENIEYGKIDVVSDITSIPLGDSFADVVVCTEVLEHVINPFDAIKEISRLLRKGGKLIFSAPMSSAHHQIPYHYYGGFTKYFYEKVFPNYELEIAEIIPNKGLYAKIMSLLWQENLPKYFQKNTFIGKFKSKLLTIFGFNLPTIIYNKFEKNKLLADHALGFYIIAYKK